MFIEVVLENTVYDYLVFLYSPQASVVWRVDPMNIDVYDNF